MFNHFLMSSPLSGLLKSGSSVQSPRYHSLHTYLENILDPFTPQFCSNLLGTSRPQHLTLLPDLSHYLWDLFLRNWGNQDSKLGSSFGSVTFNCHYHTKPHFEDSEAEMKVSEDLSVASAVLGRVTVKGRGRPCYPCIVLSKTVEDPAGPGPLPFLSSTRLKHRITS